MSPTPPTLPIRGTLLLVGLAVAVAGIFGGAFADADRAAELVGATSLGAGLLGLLGHLRWNDVERRIVSRVAAVVGVVGILVGVTLLLSPAESLASPGLYRIRAWQEALSHATIVTGIVAMVMALLGRRLETSPRWALVAPLGIVGGWTIGWEHPQSWIHAILVLSIAVGLVVASALSERRAPHGTGANLDVAAAGTLLLAGALAPSVRLDGTLGLAEVVVWATLGVGLAAISLRRGRSETVVPLVVWIALAAAQLAMYGEKWAVLATVAIGAASIAVSTRVADDADGGPMVSRTWRALAPRPSSDAMSSEHVDGGSRAAGG